ncbi:SHOCT domain-containing protein [Gordonia sp. (in: high G+C Gram-positive bacteria)]|uniref:SHOCT domain-containing protein n=1 Tax=unclassified Gordonia (in: high G+C Gram-positive bacteria) TaxID=2657482 RepID=UPI00263268C4|nr:SHOCT domain-containing protein [Gordonia sp. (in: high G+C Gram-positive bacteria)]
MDGADFIKTFLKYFAFMLVAGIVGPIFLIGYFAIGSDDARWMLWAGLGITVVDVLIALGLTTATVRGRAESSRLAVSGCPAVAEVTSLQETGMEINDRRVIAFDLRIHGPRVPSFTATKRMTVPTIAVGLLPSRVLAVQVDPETQKFEVDWDLTQLYAGSVPAVMTSTEDGVDYDLTGNREALVQVLDILSRNGIPVQGTLDLRGDPQVRGEVLEIARRYGKTRGPAGSPEPAAAAPDRRTVTQRLNEIDGLFAGGRISRAEYDDLRAKILGSL